MTENSPFVSFQKDSKKGKNKGNRLAIYELPRPRLLADIPLERNHDELHFQGNFQQQGPGPEVVLVSEEDNALFVTLDLYGAILLADWQAALDGRLVNWKYLSTSSDGAWGTAFPDRAGLLKAKGRTYALVFNAGTQGGAVLVDLKGSRDRRSCRRSAWTGKARIPRITDNGLFRMFRQDQEARQARRRKDV